MLIALFLAVCVLFAAAYFVNGRLMERWLGVDDRRKTPAHALRDDVDYVPTRSAVLFGHHFSSIAGAGPIVGPIIAGMAFGWGPALLWIVAGAIFIGGMHDFAAIYVSIRHDGKSVGQVARALLSPVTYYSFLVFILLALIYVIIVFMDLTATTFAPVATAAAAAVSEAVTLQAGQGGVVATASILYMLLALAFGLCIYRLKWSLGWCTLVFVPLVFAALWVGHAAPLTVDLVPEFLGSGKNFWSLVLIVYCFLASVLPVWILLQPRDYLSSFLLYACLVGGVIGLILIGARGEAPVSYPFFIGLRDAKLGGLFPALFVTIACGAVSGFHAIVASGTSAKQLNAESAARAVGYGGMLVEGLLAFLALAAVMLLSERSAAHPVAIFSDGIGRFVSTFGIPETAGRTFGMMAVSTFLLTTLDTSTRLCRFVVHELIGLDNRLVARVAITALVLLVPALVVFRQIPGPGGVAMPAWQAIWPAFGASNQLLAALALLVIFMWLRRQGRPTLFVALPMIFMCVTTVTALAQLAWRNLAGKGSLFVGSVSAVLLVLALLVIGNTLSEIARGKAPAAARTRPSDGGRGAEGS
jgi:carbon starvation protein